MIAICLEKLCMRLFKMIAIEIFASKCLASAHLFTNTGGRLPVRYYPAAVQYEAARDFSRLNCSNSHSKAPARKVLLRHKLAASRSLDHH